MGEKFNISNLNLYYGDFHALKDVDLSINEKEITAFIGPSGCGNPPFKMPEPHERSGTGM